MLKFLLLILLAVGVLLPGSEVWAQSGLPVFSVTDTADGDAEYSLTLQVLLLMSVLTLIPSLLIMMTSFVRVIIVLSLLRQAIGTAQTPPNQVLVGIALAGSSIGAQLRGALQLAAIKNFAVPLLAAEGRGAR
jgi:flagellar biosynthetic protein FliP